MPWKPQLSCVCVPYLFFLRLCACMAYINNCLHISRGLLQLSSLLWVWPIPSNKLLKQLLQLEEKNTVQWVFITLSLELQKCFYPSLTPFWRKEHDFYFRSFTKQNDGCDRTWLFTVNWREKKNLRRSDLQYSVILEQKPFPFCLIFFPCYIVSRIYSFISICITDKVSCCRV